MRKLFATIAVCLTLFGAFLPFSFSTETNTQIVSVVQNIAFADPEPSETLQDIEISENDFQKNAAGLDGLSGNATFGGCSLADIVCHFFSLIIDFLLFIPNLIMVVSGFFMDISLGLSINPNSYGVGGQAIETGLRTAWSIVRDFANIGFIFALFVAAFSLILGKDLLGFKPKETVVRVVIMALLVNFSFFFCRIIIQTADVFSQFIYSKITVESENLSVTGINTANLLDFGGYKSPSFAIVSQVNPQAILLEKDPTTDKTLLDNGDYDVGDAASLAIGTAFGGYYGGGWGAAAGAVAGAAGAFKFKTVDFYVVYGAIAVISFIIYLILIFTFVSVGILFLGRIFGLWVGIILAPAAFVSHAIPFLAENPYVGFNKWLSSFVKLAVTTPIFLFFLYVAVSVLRIRDTVVPEIMSSGGNGFIVTLLASLLPALAAMFILLKGKKIAVDMGGEVGALAGKLSGAVSGLALGAAVGGGALMARQGLGRVGAAVANKYADDTSWSGKNLNTLGKNLGSATYDVRNSKWAMSGIGGLTGAMGADLGLDKNKTGLQEKGGFNATGGFGQMWQDRKERLEDEQARKLEEEMAERANNPQSPENIAKRNAERRKKKAEEARKAEEQRIAMEAENTTVDSLVDAERLNLAGTNQEISDINAQLAANPAISAAVEQATRQAGADADRRVRDLQTQMAEHEKNKPVGLVTASAQRAYDDKKAQLEQEKQQAILDQQAATQAISDMKTQKQTHEDLSKKKAELEKTKQKQTDNIKQYSKYLGKTIAEVKSQVDILKVEKLNTTEGKEMLDAEKEVKDAEKKINDLNKEAAELRKEGKVAEAKLKQEEAKKKQNDLIKARKEYTDKKENFEKKHGIKELEDIAKNGVRDYKKSQEPRLKKFNQEIRDADVELKKAAFAADQRQKQILEAHAKATEEFAKSWSNGFTESVAVITGGRAGTGALIGDTAQRAAASVREKALNKKKGQQSKPPENKNDGDKK